MSTRPADLFGPRTEVLEPHGSGILAVEIGGTTMRVARFDTHANLRSAINRVPVPNYLSHPQSDANELQAKLLDRLRGAARTLFEHHVPTAVVVAYPGPVTSDGVALRSPTILGPQRVCEADIASSIRGLWPSSKIHVLNDLTCAGHHFVGRGERDFCVITVGSGIGNKIFLGGTPQIGACGFGGEIGHLQVSPRPGTPVANVKGELGEIASGRGAVWLARQWPGRMAAGAAEGRPDIRRESEALVRAFHANDPRARGIIGAGAHPLALTMSSLHLGLGVTRFFIVGGFAKALGRAYRALLVDSCRELTWDAGQDWNAMIELGEAGIEEGLFGAALFSAQELRATGRGAVA